MEQSHTKTRATSKTVATDVQTPQNVPFLRQLATSDNRARASALDSLRLYLQGHGAFNELELLKLWKGLYYCMWMSDRPRTQQQLAVDLADLVDILREENVLPFLDAFWKTMAREWGGIDRLRMDKFLYLVRRYLYTSFVHCLRHSSSVASHVEILTATPLNPTDPRLPNGLRYHVLDIYVDELDKASSEAKETPLDVLRQLLSPVEQMAVKSPTKSVRKRARETLEDERVRTWCGEGANGNVVKSADPLSAEEDGAVDGVAEKQESGVHAGQEEDEWSGIEED